MRTFAFILALCALASVSLCLVNAEQPPTQDIASGPVDITDGWSWTDCGLDTDPVQIESIEVSPNPPQPGQDLTVTVTGTVLEEISEGAYADVTVKLGIIKILHQRFDICEEARNANASIQCPVKRGTYTVAQTVALPKDIPQAKFTVDVQGYTVDDDDLLCLKLKVNFKKNPLSVKGFPESTMKQ